MSYRVPSRHLIGVVFSVLLALLACAPLQAQSTLRTRNIVLIVSDGLRWQEITQRGLYLRSVLFVPLISEGLTKLSALVGKVTASGMHLQSGCPQNRTQLD